MDSRGTLEGAEHDWLAVSHEPATRCCDVHEGSRLVEGDKIRIAPTAIRPLPGRLSSAATFEVIAGRIPESGRLMASHSRIVSASAEGEPTSKRVLG
ncbi:MAG: hypothetical protein ABJD11_16725 [Gemmatimonadota bacterium]